MTLSGPPLDRPVAALDAGGRVVVAQTFDGDEILTLLRRFRPTVLAMMAFSLLQAVRSPGARRDDFETLRICHSGGDKVPAELEHEFTALSGLDIAEGYGLTESGIVAHNPPAGPIKSGRRRTGDAGHAVVDPPRRWQRVATSGVGRLWVKSGAVMTGYWNDPAATAVVISDGWLDTGDVMRADEDGYLWFRRPPETDHRPRRLQHLAAGSRGCPARASGGRRRWRDRCAQSNPR